MSENDFSLLLIQIAILISAAACLGRLAQKFHFPKVAGELAAGFLLGPSVFQILAPGLHAQIFPSEGMTAAFRGGLAQIGLVFFMFCAGLELNAAQLRKNGKVVVSISFFGMVLPFLFGWMSVFVFPEWFGTLPADQKITAFFLGTALSISALPVIAKILMDMNLLQTRFGTLVMSSATINDLAGWALFSALLSIWQDGHFSLSTFLMKAAVLLASGMLVLLLEKQAHHIEKFVEEKLRGGALSLVFAFAMLSAAGAHAAGIHPAFGAFLAGALLAPGLNNWSVRESAIFRFISVFFAPLYFSQVGLKINFLSHFDARLVFLILAAAFLGKLIGVTAGGLLGGIKIRESLALAFAMNARGAVEMILASIALERGLISERLFVALVIMALVTSIISGPVIKRLLRKSF